jgi:hypothetical protein
LVLLTDMYFSPPISTCAKFGTRLAHSTPWRGQPYKGYPKGTKFATV